MSNDLTDELSPSYFIDSDNSSIIEFSRSIVLNETDPVRQAIALYQMLESIKTVIWEKTW